MKKWGRARQKYPRGCICGTWSLRYKDCVTPIRVYFSVKLVPSLVPFFHWNIQYKNSVDSQSMLYMQDMDPGPAKMLHKPGKGDTIAVCQAGGWTRKQDTGKLAKNIKIICLQTPIWKVSCRRSIISGLLGSFNGKWLGFSMVCSESELRLVELFSFPG